jgi:hypothetical protein
VSVSEGEHPCGGEGRREASSLDLEKTRRPRRGVQMTVILADVIRSPEDRFRLLQRTFRAAMSNKALTLIVAIRH